MLQLHFSQRAAWRVWLRRHHASEPWIDSIIKRLDEGRYLRKFTPRTSTGHWSAINLDRIRRLKREGRMTAAGLAKLDRGVEAYVPLAQRRLTVPADLRCALAGNARARESFECLAPSYRRHYLAWIATAKKAETRARRLKETLALLARNKKLGMK